MSLPGGKKLCGFTMLLYDLTVQPEDQNVAEYTQFYYKGELMRNVTCSAETYKK